MMQAQAQAMRFFEQGPALEGWRLYFGEWLCFGEWL